MTVDRAVHLAVRSGTLCALTLGAAAATVALILRRRHTCRTSLITSTDVCVEQLLTVIITTSPTQSNPSTKMLERVVASFANVPLLQACQKVIVCDGYNVRNSRRSHKGGVILPEEESRYREYVDRIRELCRTDASFRDATVLLLPSRHGFGWAVREALSAVTTPFVIVVQHDRAFLRACNLLPLLAALRSHAQDVKYIMLPNRLTKNYQQTMAAVHKTHLVPAQHGRVLLLPLWHWFDSTHLASVEHYQRCVFGSGHVRRGDFIEDSFGIHVKRDVLANGSGEHAKYGTWLLCDPVLGMEPVVGHLDARGCWAKWADEADAAMSVRRSQSVTKADKQAAKRAAQQKSREKAALRGLGADAAELKGRGGYFCQLAQLAPTPPRSG